MPHIRFVVEKVKENLNTLEANFIKSTSEDDSAIQKDIKRRFFINEFAKLAEQLIFFRSDKHAYNEKDKEEINKNYAEQLKLTAPLSNLLDKNEKNLIARFISFRNKLLHQYPIDYYRINSNLYEKAKDYFTKNNAILEKALDALIATEDYSRSNLNITKISFDPPEYKKVDATFEKDYFLPLEVAIKEIKQLILALKENSIDVNELIDSEHRKKNGIFHKQAYNFELEEFCLKKKDNFSENIYLMGALSNFIQNISELLSRTNMAYETLGKNKNLEIIWKELNELFNKVKLEEPTAIRYLITVASERVGLAHDYETTIDLKEIMSSIVKLSILNTSYLEPTLDEILNADYRSLLITESNLGTSSTSTSKIAITLDLLSNKLPEELKQQQSSSIQEPAKDTSSPEHKRARIEPKEEPRVEEDLVSRNRVSPRENNV